MRWGVVAILLTSSAARAYPIPPRTLWQLTADADLIVVAEVGPTRRVEDGDTWNSAVAPLDVVETWKGDAAAKLEVPYPAGLLCPAPPRYIEGETVLAFLEKDEGAWGTVALSYGTLYPSAADLPVFRERVRAALELQKREKLEVEAVRAWHVETAVRSATRWHGLYPLEPGGDPIHAFYDRERQALGGLTEAELTRLAEGWVAEPDPGMTLPMVLELLAGFSHRDVDTTAVAAIDALMEEEELPYWAGPAMARVLERVGKKKAWKPTPKPEEPLLQDPLFGLARKSDEELRALWVEHRPDIDVPELTLAKLRRPRVRGVGADTPP